MPNERECGSVSDEHPLQRCERSTQISFLLQLLLLLLLLPLLSLWD